MSKMIVAAAAVLALCLLSSCSENSSSSVDKSNVSESVSTAATTQKEVETSKQKATTSETTAITTETLPQTSQTTSILENEKMFSSYSKIIKTGKSRYEYAHEISYFVIDYDNDGNYELIMHYLTGARFGEIEIYDYDPLIDDSSLEAKGSTGNTIGYSTKLKALVSSTVNSGVGPPDYPSGARVEFLKMTVSNGEISIENVGNHDLGEKQNASIFDQRVQINTDEAFSVVQIKANAQHNMSIK